MCFSDPAKVSKRGRKPRRLDFVGGADPPGAGAVGWRGWRVEIQGGEPVLLSPNQGSRWEPGKPMDGKVDAKKAGGIYCFKTLAKLRGYGLVKVDDAKTVIGQVLLWGQVAEHGDGYRGEHGYPLKLWTNDITLQSRLRDRYGASVEIGYARDLKAA
jgi:hypothetical protein